MIFALNDFAVLITKLLPPQEDLKTMNKLRCFLFASIVVIASATLALGGEIQGPGKSEPPPPASATESATDGVTEPTSSGESQIAWLDLAITLIGELPTIF